ncbi:MAG: type VI secretion system membrane subunit TssM, partial [Nitrosospira sp.]
MKSVFKLLFNRRTMTILGLAALSLLIWFAGPLIAVAEYYPLESDTVRLILIVFIAIIYVGKLVWSAIKAKNLNAKLMEGLLRHPSTPSQPADNAGAEEVAILRKRFEEAVEVLKQANLGGSARNPLLALLTRGQYVYELPWYIFIGAPGSGKTTALVNSGLQFPFAERFGQEMLRGIGGTRNCDWWFTNEAVLLDTAGRYTTQESNREADSAAWTGFLQLLKKYRPRRPINGVIVTISVADLLQQTPAQREAQARAIRKRIQELHEELNIRFPLYVLVTKADLLAGFMEFFDEYGKEERAQVWGMTFPLSENQDSPPLNSFTAEFLTLEKRLNERLIDRLEQERDIEKRSLLYTFPQQFSRIKEVLAAFLNQVFSPSRFEQQPLLRGLYFTSGTQEGNPIDRAMGTLARALHLDRKLLPPNKPSGKSFFLTRLVKDVIFSEAGLAGTNLRWERKHAALQWSMFGIAGLITLGAIAAWSVSYSNNKNYVAQVNAKIPVILEKIEELPVLQSMDIVSLLPVLNSVRDLTDAATDKNEDVPLSMGLGLYQGEKLAAASDNVYQKLLRDAFLPQMVLRIERLLSTDSRENLELLYEGLKAYLMLHQPKHLDPVALKAFITTDWEVSLPREVTVEQRSQLESHLDNLLLAPGQLSSPIPANEQLIANVRHTLARIPIAQRIYGRIKQLEIGTEIPEFTIAKAAGPAALLVFTRVSGQPLTQGVPGLYSYAGYHEAFPQAAKEVTEQLSAEEAWVLGLKEKDRPRWINSEAEARLLNEVRRLYLEDYASVWSAFINDIRLVQPTNLQKSIETSRILSAADSPLVSLMRSIVKQVTLVDVEESEKTAMDGAADKVKAARSKLEKLFGKTSEKTQAETTDAKLENFVDDRFKELRYMV